VGILGKVRKEFGSVTTALSITMYHAKVYPCLWAAILMTNNLMGVYFYESEIDVQVL